MSLKLFSLISFTENSGAYLIHFQITHVSYWLLLSPHLHLLHGIHLFKLVLNPVQWFELWAFGCFLPYASLCNTASFIYLQLSWDVLDKEPRLFTSFHMKNTHLVYSGLVSLTRVEEGHGLCYPQVVPSLRFSSSLISPTPYGPISKKFPLIQQYSSIQISAPSFSGLSFYSGK